MFIAENPAHISPQIPRQSSGTNIENICKCSAKVFLK